MTLLRAGLIGDHISRTRLPAALQIMCDDAGWALDFSLIDTAGLEDFDFDATVEQARLDGWSGVTVTHPHKPLARHFAGAGMTANVAHLGAANTLTFAGGLRGFNTDYTGTLAALAAQDVATGPVMMMGAGGVAEAIGPALMAMGCSVQLHDLNTARAKDLAQRIGATVADDPRAAVQQATGLVNATALGMAEYPGSAFEQMDLGPQAWAFDAVYTPPQTRFLTEAKSAGLHTISGFDLFRAMAVRSFEAYTGLTVDQPRILPLLDTLKPE